MPVTGRRHFALSNPATIALILLLTCLWAVNAFAELYFFAVPNMDNWCYFAPSVLAPSPGRLTTPFLGGFGGADHVWGLQWPGVVLVNSVIFSLLPRIPALWIAWQIVLWIGCALALAWLTWSASRSQLATVTAYFFVLCDRALAFIAGWERMELFAFIVATPLVIAMLRDARNETSTPRARGIVRISAAMTPWTHPLATALTAATIAIRFYLRRCERADRREILLQGAIAIVSTAALGGWFVLRPPLLAQFKDHAAAAATVFSLGKVLFGAMKEIYLPLVSAPLFYLGGVLLACAIAIVAWRKTQLTSDERVCSALSFLTLALVVALHVFKNSYYIVFLLLPLLPLWAAALVRLKAMLPSFARTPAWLPITAAILLVACHGAFWVTRGWKWRAAGSPNLRAELRQFWTKLPAAQQIFIPETLWEEAAANPKPATQIRMNTIINAASPSRRLAYESYAYDTVVAGDLLIVDDYQTNPPLTPLRSARWQLLATTEHHLPGHVPWGYGFRVYRAQ